MTLSTLSSPDAAHPLRHRSSRHQVGIEHSTSRPGASGVRAASMLSRVDVFSGLDSQRGSRLRQERVRGAKRRSAVASHG